MNYIIRYRLKDEYQYLTEDVKTDIAPFFGKSILDAHFFQNKKYVEKLCEYLKQKYDKRFYVLPV